MASEIKESESPPSQSQRADPQQSQSAAKLNKVYVFFWHAYSSVMYSLYEIEVPKHLHPPPDKATQAYEIENPKRLLPVLQLKTGQYPDGMSCVSLGSKLYFVGGEFNMDNPYIDEDVKKNFKNSERDVFPRQLLILDLSEVGASGDELHKLLVDGKQMRSGKARPHAFVAEKKIYVIGSTIESSISHRSKLTRLNLESFINFEVYDPEVGQWHDLPDPPIGNVKTRWVGHAIVRGKALLVAWQGGKERLYCFDLGESRWTDASIPFYPENFSGRTEFVEDTLYGCYHNTIAAIAPVEETKIEKEEKKEKVEAEEGEKMEAEKVKAKETVEAEEEEEDAKDFGQGWLLENPHLHVLSEEMGMDAIFNVPPQVQSSSSLLHLGNKYFCYVKSGMPPNSDNDSDDVIKDDKKRLISIVIFLALGKKYEKDGTGLLQAQFLYSAHYEINSRFPNEGFINGCFFPGLMTSVPYSQRISVPISVPYSQRVPISVPSCLKSSNVKLDDVAGLYDCKKLLKEAAILPIEFPHFFTGNRKPWKAILLYGPPGTGKTLVANAIATDAGSAFFSVSASNIVSKWMGESGKEVSNLFQSARDEAPSIIFIDEIDSLYGSRGNDNENEASRRIKTEFLVQMQAVSNDAKNVLVLAATNTPYHVDAAMRRCFDKRIYIPLPNLKAREQIFKSHIGKTPHKLSPEDFQDLASKTEGFSGSDISIFVKEALYQPVRATLDAKFFRENYKGMWVPCKDDHSKAVEVTIEDLKARVTASKIQLPSNTKEDFNYVLASQKPTVSVADLQVYEDFTKKYGING